MKLGNIRRDRVTRYKITGIYSVSKNSQNCRALIFTALMRFNSANVKNLSDQKVNAQRLYSAALPEILRLPHKAISAMYSNNQTTD